MAETVETLQRILKDKDESLFCGTISGVCNWQVWQDYLTNNKKQIINLLKDITSLI